jgi:hypothetical protein
LRAEVEDQVVSLIVHWPRGRDAELGAFEQDGSFRNCPLLVRRQHWQQA